MPPAVSKVGTVGLPTCEIAILDTDGKPLKRGEEGQIAVRGPRVVSGYDVNDAERTAAVFSDGWFRTGDIGFLDDDGYLTLSGRMSDVINRGGQKVSALEVERALRLSLDVDDCICFPIKHRTLGQLIATAVVLRPEAVYDEDGLRRFLHGRLAQFKVPTRIVAWDAIPRGSAGKPARNKASEQFARSGRNADEQ